MALLHFHEAFGPLFSQMQLFGGMLQAMSDAPKGLSLSDGSGEGGIFMSSMVFSSDGSNTVYETKQRFTDGRGHEAMSVQRGINDQAKRVVRERRGSDESYAQHFRNVRLEDQEHFDARWAAARAGPVDRQRVAGNQEREEDIPYVIDRRSRTRSLALPAPSDPPQPALALPAPAPHASVRAQSTGERLPQSSALGTQNNTHQVSREFHPNYHADHYSTTHPEGSRPAQPVADRSQRAGVGSPARVHDQHTAPAYSQRSEYSRDLPGPQRTSQYDDRRPPAIPPTSHRERASVYSTEGQGGGRGPAPRGPGRSRALSAESSAARARHGSHQHALPPETNEVFTEAAPYTPAAPRPAPAVAPSRTYVHPRTTYSPSREPVPSRRDPADAYTKPQAQTQHVGSLSAPLRSEHRHSLPPEPVDPRLTQPYSTPSPHLSYGPTPRHAYAPGAAPGARSGRAASSVHDGRAGPSQYRA